MLRVVFTAILFHALRAQILINWKTGWYTFCAGESAEFYPVGLVTIEQRLCENNVSWCFATTEIFRVVEFIICTGQECTSVSLDVTHHFGEKIKSVAQMVDL